MFFQISEAFDLNITEDAIGGIIERINQETTILLQRNHTSHNEFVFIL
jgi:hypothetical protein